MSDNIPDDNFQRNLIVARPETDRTLPHIGVVGDTYTILLTGEDTAGRFCLIDMHIPPGGGPPPHRHDFEETFTILEGELDATFRRRKQVVRAGETIKFFLEVGVFVASRTTPPPKLDETAQAEFRAKSEALAPKYRTELLQHA